MIVRIRNDGCDLISTEIYLDIICYNGCEIPCDS
jgi:hypothetical protein